MDTVHECDRRTDGRTDRITMSITKTAQRMASRGKKKLGLYNKAIYIIPAPCSIFCSVICTNNSNNSNAFTRWQQQISRSHYGRQASFPSFCRQSVEQSTYTVGLHTSPQHRHWRSSGSVSRLIFSGVPIRT